MQRNSNPKQAASTPCLSGALRLDALCRMSSNHFGVFVKCALLLLVYEDSRTIMLMSVVVLIELLHIRNCLPDSGGLKSRRASLCTR